MTSLQKLLHFKGSNFLLPMFLTALVYTFVPDLLLIGPPFSGLFSSEATFFIIAVLLLVSGVQTKIEDFPKVIKSFGPILLLKIGITVIFTLLWRSFFPDKGLLGISAVTICAVLLSCNPGMYLVLLGKNINETEESAFSVINLLMLPALPLIILSIGQSQVSLLLSILANVLPFLIGLLMGIYLPELRQTLRPLSMLLIPFLAVTFGAKLNLLIAMNSIVAGLLLSFLFYIGVAVPLVMLDKKINHHHGRMALSLSSVAAISMAIPGFVANYLNLSQQEVSQSMSQIAFVVILSSYLTPFLYDKLIPKKELSAQNERLFRIQLNSDYPPEMIEKIRQIEWGAGQHLARRIETKDLAVQDRIFVLQGINQDLIGFVGYTQQDIAKDANYGPFLSTLYVNPNYRGQGKALQLMDLVINEARKQGVKKLYTLTQHEGLYEKQGFYQVDTVLDKTERHMRVLVKEI